MASCTATTTPPRAVPSSLVTTIPVTGTAAAKVFACITAFCPMVPSSTSNDSCGAPGSRVAMTRATFMSSCMSPSLVCRRPAVSMITTSVPRVTAASMAEKATAAGSPPGCESMNSLPLRLQFLEGAGVRAAAHEDADVAEGDILYPLPETLLGLEQGHVANRNSDD